MALMRRVPTPFFRVFPVLPLLAFAVSFRVEASEAVIDLHDWDVDQAPIVPLSGTWEIYWSELLEPTDLSSLKMESDAAVPAPTGHFEMPGIWNDWPSVEEALGGVGYATFRATVLLPPELHVGAMRIPNASTAYRLWGNGMLLAESGEPGTDQRSTRPHYQIKTARYEAPDGRLDLVLQVANFHHRRGGMWRSIEIGSISGIESKHALESAYDLLLIGSFIGLIVYNLLVWRTVSKRSKAPLLLAILFAVVAVRISMMGQMMVTKLIPDFPWAVQLRIEYLTAHFALLTLTLILHVIYPQVVNRWVTIAVGVLTAVNTLSVLIMPLLVYSRIVALFVYAMIGLLAIEIILLVTSLLRGRRETWAGIGAVAITLLITVGETIHYQGWILSRDFAPFGFVISMVTGGSLNQSTAYLVSAALNLLLVFLVANFLAVRGSRSLLVIEEREGNAKYAASSTGLAMQADADALRGKRLRAEFRLTRREAEIAALVAQGLGNKEIGAKLYVSEATVKTHVYRILRKASVGNRTELSRWYYSLPFVNVH
jgi:DNA-binding CsgD family transcriptional regulator